MLYHYIYIYYIMIYIYNVKIYIYIYISLATIWENEGCESKNVNFLKVLEILF